MWEYKKYLMWQGAWKRPIAFAHDVANARTRTNGTRTSESVMWERVSGAASKRRESTVTFTCTLCTLTLQARSLFMVNRKSYNHTVLAKILNNSSTTKLAQNRNQHEQRIRWLLYSNLEVIQMDTSSLIVKLVFVKLNGIYK